MSEINRDLDTTPLPPNNLVAQDPQSAELAGYVRTKTFGRDVREAIARSIELNSTRSKSAEELASETVNVANDLTDRFNQQIGALTEDSEVIDARGGKATLGQRLDETTAQLAQTENKLESDFVNIAEFGAIGDYYLEDGSVNPNPTDNTAAIQNAFNQSNKVRIGKGAYYCFGKIDLPRNPVLEGNDATIIFEKDGFNLGEHGWNKPVIKDLHITQRGRTKLGKAIYSELSGDVVRSIFSNVTIDGFNRAIYNKTANEFSNFTWANNENIQIQFCTVGIHLIGGYINTSRWNAVSITQTDKQAILVENCLQFHRFTFDKLTVDFCAIDRTNTSPINFKNCENGEVMINDVYFEHNGYMRKAKQEEIADFTLNGTKITGHFYDSKSWELNGEMYSEDTGYITQKDLQGAATVRFENCKQTTQVYLQNIYIVTNVYGVVSFTNSPLYVHIDGLHLVNNGYSFPNVRHIFTNTTPAQNVTIYTEKMSNEGGGSSFKYGEVLIKGELFGRRLTTEKFASPTLLNGWKEALGFFGVYKEKDKVYFQGSVAIDSLVLGSTIFTLSEQLRPKSTLVFNAVRDGDLSDAIIYIQTNGNVVYTKGGNNTDMVKWVSLSNISFKVE